MHKLSSGIAGAVITIAFVAMICVSPRFGHSTAAADPPLNNTQLKALYEEKCSACHDAYDPGEKGYTAAEWQSTVNRMMFAHNAQTSITAAQATEIVTYLSEFVPGPAQIGKSSDIGVWQTDPSQSVSYPFTYAPNLQSFDIRGGLWKIVTSPDTFSGYLKAFNSSPNNALLIENKDQFAGALDARCQVEMLKASSASVLGLVFGEIDEKNFLVAEYKPITQNLSLVDVADGVPRVLQQVTVPANQLTTTSPWHDLRVKVSQGGVKVEVWLDYQRQITSTFPQWTGGRVGILAAGGIAAGCRQLSIDTYQPFGTSPAGDVMLH